MENITTYTDFLNESTVEIEDTEEKGISIDNIINLIKK